LPPETSIRIAARGRDRLTHVSSATTAGLAGTPPLQDPARNVGGPASVGRRTTRLGQAAVTGGLALVARW
jgi:hypothetical protein